MNTSSIILDTNLLVLFLVRSTDKKLIEKHKRTKAFDIDDFNELITIIKRFRKIISNPYILAETSNLISQTDEDKNKKIKISFINFLKTSEEKYENSLIVTQQKDFIRLGLTDASILDLVEQSFPLITVDLDLYLASSKISKNVLNFNYIRQKRFFS